MKPKIKNITIILLVCILICVCVLSYMNSHKSNKLLSKKDLDGCEMFVHNLTCGTFEARTVTDEEVYDEIMSLCLKAETFRPFVMPFDTVLGGNDTYIQFINSSYCYSITILDPELQLSLDYIHRDHPMIYVGMAEKRDARTSDSVWAWYCELTPRDYARLCELAELHADGEIVTDYRYALWSK